MGSSPWDHKGSDMTEQLSLTHSLTAFLSFSSVIMADIHMAFVEVSLNWQSGDCQIRLLMTWYMSFGEKKAATCN